jgi:maleate cis-trans isomerase
VASVGQTEEQLKEAGIEVVSLRALGRNLDQNKVSSPLADHELALELGRAALTAAPEAQALLLPGGLWFAIHAVPILEAEFGKPVLLNITSTTWAALNAAPKPLKQKPDPRWGKVMGSV